VTKPVKRDDHLAVAAEVLQQRAASYVKYYQQPSIQPPIQPRQESSERQYTDMLTRLEAQAQRINELSSAQEAAMLELKAIAEKAERDWKTGELESTSRMGDRFDARSICEYGETAVPHIKKDDTGAFIVTTRSIDLFKAEREANLMADALRHRAVSSTHSPSRRPSSTIRRSRRRLRLEMGTVLRKGFTTVLKWVSAPKATGLRFHSRPVDVLEMPSFSLQTATIWVIGAVVARVGLDLLLLAFPGMWIPVIGLIVAPAAIALYRTTVAPQTGIVWGYRLLLVMIGLLIGGRL
jgi:hypothetical protein